jgi:GPH family glycoside/pentoside/hexuronide:cation symporter
VLRVAFSVFVLPYAALGAELTRDYAERSVLMTFRSLFNNLGVILALLLGYSVFMSGEGGLLSREAYVPFGWTCAAIVLVATLVSAFSTMGLRHLAYEAAPQKQGAAARAFRDFAEVFRNPSFVILFATVLAFWISQGAAAVLTNHALLFFWALPAGVIQFMPIATVVGNVAGVPVCGLLLRRHEKRDICAAALGLFCLSQFLPVTLAVLGLMPSGTTLYVILGAFAFFVGILGTCALITFGSMMMDAADEHDFLFGVRREGLYFAGLVFSGKTAIGVGFIFAGVALDLIGFPQGIGAETGRLVPPDTARNLGLIAGPGAALISLASVFILLRYRLGRQELAHVQRELGTRRLAAAARD